MRALPEIDTMAGLALAGLDHRAYAHTNDRLVQMLDVAVAERVLETRAHNSEQRRKNLAVEIGNNVGSVVGPALSQTLQAISRAIRG